MFNKSEIMKKAWSNYKTGNYETFAVALKQAWRTAKREIEKRIQGFVNASEINTGDTIEIEHGDYGNFVTCVVKSISKELYLGKYYTVSAASTTSGLEVRFCPAPTDSIKRIAQATTLQLAA